MNVHEVHRWKDPQLPFICREMSRSYAHRVNAMNWHENLELIYVLEGAGYVLCDGVRISVCDGDVVAISPNAMHEVCAEDRVIYRYLIVDRAFCLANCFDTNLLFFRPTAIREPEVCARFDELIALYAADETTPFRVQKIRAAILSLLAYVCARYAEPASWQGDSHVLSAMKEVIGRIRAEVSSPELSPSVLADSVGLSHSYFARRFRQITGHTCVAYINLTRCERAKELLAEGERENGEIARLCGFCSHSYFDRVFRSVVGMSPSDYRALCERSVRNN